MSHENSNAWSRCISYSKRLPFQGTTSSVFEGCKPWAKMEVWTKHPRVKEVWKSATNGSSQSPEVRVPWMVPLLKGVKSPFFLAFFLGTPLKVEVWFCFFSSVILFSWQASFTSCSTFPQKYLKFYGSYGYIIVCNDDTLPEINSLHPSKWHGRRSFPFGMGYVP